MNLVRHLERRAAQHPERVAFVEEDGAVTRSVTYSELYSYVCGASDRLKQDGFQQGDIILILQPVSIQLYISLLGVFHAGMRAMFIDPSAGVAMIRKSLRRYRPVGFIGSPLAQWLRLVVPELWKLKRSYCSKGWVPLTSKWNIDAAGGGSTPLAVVEDCPALITFTSGSTGVPKAACRSHGFLLAQNRALADALDYRESEVDLVTLPIFAMANIAAGMVSVIANTDLRFPVSANSKLIAEQCRRHEVSRCSASPAFFLKLQRDGLMPSFKTIYTGGAPVFPSHLERMQNASPEVRIVIVFGSTEAEPISHIDWCSVDASDRQRMREGGGLLVGAAVQQAEVKIIKDQGCKALAKASEEELQKLVLTAGERGELIVTGDHVLEGYLDGVGDDESKIRVGAKVWHRTGDAAYLDDLGRLWLVGRCSAAIDVDGDSKIYSFGIECAAMEITGVERCALLLHEQKVTLFLQSEGVDCGEVQSALSHLGVEKVIQIEEVPMDRRHNAKVDYVLLREAVSTLG